MILLYILTSLLPAVTAPNETEDMRILYSHIPPLNYHESGKAPYGFKIDMLTEILNRVDIDFKFVVMPLARVLALTQRGKNSIGIFANRGDVEKYYFRSDKAMFSMKLNIYWINGTKALNTLDDLNNRSVIKRLGYLYPTISSRLLTYNIKFYHSSSALAGLKMLHAQRADYLLEYQNFIEVMPSNMLNQVESLGLPGIDFHFYVHKQLPDAKVHLTKINRVIDELKSKGLIKKCIEFYAKQTETQIKGHCSFQKP